MVGSCEYGNEHYGIIDGGVLLNNLGTIRFSSSALSHGFSLLILLV
jgi:hypothetical protein